MLGLCHWVVKFVHFVTAGPFGLHGFGRFAGLPGEDLHGVIYLTVLGFAAAGICRDAVLLRGKQCREGISRDP